MYEMGDFFLPPDTCVVEHRVGFHVRDWWTPKQIHHVETCAVLYVGLAGELLVPKVVPLVTHAFSPFAHLVTLKRVSTGDGHRVRGR